MKAKTVDDYHLLAEQYNLEWVGGELPANTSVKTTWRCKAQGHTWIGTYHHILTGRGCYLCSRRAPKTEAAYHQLAHERGFRWIGDLPANTHVPTTWECPHQHQWTAPYYSLQMGTGCPTCHTLARDKSAEDYHALAASRGVKWVGELPDNTHLPTTWECELKHRWCATYATLRSGSGCPMCWDQTHRKSPEDYHALAATRGLTWLGPYPFFARDKTAWRCSASHEWNASYHAVQDLSGCPICARKARKSVEDYHALASQHNLRWIGKQLPETATSRTQWQCQAGHQWSTSYNRITNGSGCARCAGNARKTVEDYHALAHRRGFRWLGTQALPVAQKTLWECGHGHRWKAPYNSLQQGTGCPKCAMRTRRHSPPKTKHDYYRLASKRGFKWVAPFGRIPRTTTHKTLWECSAGHRWETTFQHIQRGHGCPVCVGVAPKSRADYEELARQRGFRLLGDIPQPSHVPVEWECSQGHAWFASFSNVQDGTGCPTCARLNARRSSYSARPKLTTKQRRFRLNQQYEAALRELVAQDPTATIEWYCDEWVRKTGVTVSFGTMSRALFRLGLLETGNRPHPAATASGRQSSTGETDSTGEP